MTSRYNMAFTLKIKHMYCYYVGHLKVSLEIYFSDFRIYPSWKQNTFHLLIIHNMIINFSQRWIYI